MKKSIKVVFLIAVTVIAGYGSYMTKSTDVMSTLALANVEALAFDEGPVDPNIAYGYQLTNCYDKNKKLIGAVCAPSEDRKAECKYTSAWGKCN